MGKPVKRDVYIPDGIELSISAGTPEQAAGSPNAERVHFGHEFCDRLIPSKTKIREIISAATDAGRQVTFLTPVCTDEGIEELKPLLELFGGEVEVVVNDWGIIELCAEIGIRPVLGRVLTACTRDPRFMRKLPGEDSLLYEYIRSSSMNSKEFQEFLLERNITRIELDNTIQFYNFKPFPEIRAALHFPYVYSSTTRRCLYPFAYGQSPPRQLLVSQCNRECRKTRIEFNVPSYSLDMLVIGNAQFYENIVLPDKERLDEFNIDRIVADREPGFNYYKDGR